MQPLKIKLFDCLDGEKLHSGTQHRLGNRFCVAEVILLSLRIRPDIPGRHQPRIVAECLELPTQVMRPDACLHADEATRHVGEPDVDLVARQLLAQNDSAHFVEADEVERVLADVDADCPTRFGWWSWAAWEAPGVGSPVPPLRLGGAGARRVHPINGRLEKRTLGGAGAGRLGSDLTHSSRQ